MRIISGRFKGRTIKTSQGPGYRPATGKVRESLFSMLESRLVDWSEQRVLDLFAGSGSLGMEALSRGAPFVTFVEKSKKAARVLQTNLNDLGADAGNWNIIVKDALSLLTRPPDAAYTLIFIDPPYRHEMLGSALNRVVAKGWIDPDGIICAEIEADVDHEPFAEELNLEIITDRLYGQTRIVLWNPIKPKEPLSPEPSTP